MCRPLTCLAIGLALSCPATAAPLRLAQPPVPLFRGERLPVPPEQNAPWTAPPGPLPPELVSTASKLFDQGLPDPRGCDYRSVEVLGENIDSFSILFQAPGLEVVREEHGWLLPPCPDHSRRFVILRSGVLAPTLAYGDGEGIRTDTEAWLESDFRGGQGSLALLSCFLVRLGNDDLAARAWHKSLEGRTPAEQYLIPAGDWLRDLHDRAVRDHKRGDDRLALLHLRELARAGKVVQADPAFLGAKRTRRDRSGFDPGLFVRAAPLLADQERRATEPDRVPALELGVDRFPDRETRVAALVRDLDQVGIQADGTGNWGEPQLDTDSIVQALACEGGDAVEPLIECLEHDTRLTRSSAVIWTGSYPCEMAGVTDAAYAALSAIIGRGEMAEIDSGVKGEGQRTRSKLAAALRAYWKKRREGRMVLGWDKEIGFNFSEVSLRRVLELLYEGSGLDYFVSEQVADLPVTLDLRGLTLRDALRRVVTHLRARVRGFHARMDTDTWIYFFRPS